MKSWEVPDAQSVQQHLQGLYTIFIIYNFPTTATSIPNQLDRSVSVIFNPFQNLEENIVTFVKNKLKKIQKVLSPDYQNV